MRSFGTTRNCSGIPFCLWVISMFLPTLSLLPLPFLFCFSSFLCSGDQTSILIPAILVPFPVAMRKYSAKHLKGEEIYSGPQVKGLLWDGEGVNMAGTWHSWSAGHVASTTGSREGWLNVTAQLCSHLHSSASQPGGWCHPQGLVLPNSSKSKQPSTGTHRGLTTS